MDEGLEIFVTICAGDIDEACDNSSPAEFRSDDRCFGFCCDSLEVKKGEKREDEVARGRSATKLLRGGDNAADSKKTQQTSSQSAQSTIMDAWNAINIGAFRRTHGKSCH